MLLPTTGPLPFQCKACQLQCPWQLTARGRLCEDGMPSHMARGLTGGLRRVTEGGSYIQGHNPGGIICQALQVYCRTLTYVLLPPWSIGRTWDAGFAPSQFCMIIMGSL